MQQTERKKPMSRIRLNQEFRNKIGTRMRVHLEQEDKHKRKKNSFQAREESFLDNLYKMRLGNSREEIVCQDNIHQDDVKMAHYHLQDKYPNVNTIAKDSCFPFWL